MSGWLSSRGTEELKGEKLFTKSEEEPIRVTKRYRLADLMPSVPVRIELIVCEVGPWWPVFSTEVGT